MTERWHPHVTVAAVIADGDRFLFVEESVDGGVRLNQPAGHLEPGEGLLEAVRREALEETARIIEPTGIVGIYRWCHPERNRTFLRTTFAARVVSHEHDRALDPDIHRTVWLTAGELTAARERWRSPMVGRCVDDYLGSVLHPLDLLHDLA